MSKLKIERVSVLSEPRLNLARQSVATKPPADVNIPRIGDSPLASDPKGGQGDAVGKSRRTTLGIDLGTTNTVIATNAEALPFTVDGELKETMPSVVAYPPDGQPLVGRDARWRRAIDPKNTIASSKRIIGSRWGAMETKRFDEAYAYELVDVDGSVGFRTRAGINTPVDVGATIAGEICDRAGVQREGVRAVVSVPVAFDDARRKATIAAIRQAGFSEVASIDEPVATALAYLNRSALKYAVVYDLGGGTFDVAVVECEEYPFKVVGHAGDPYLGGDDVDRWIANKFAQRVLASSSWDLTDAPETYAKLVFHCENAKIGLSNSDEVSINVQDIDLAAPASCGVETITRKEVQALTLDLVRRSFVLCDAALCDAGILARDVDAVFLAGGSTRLPSLHEYVAQYFDKKPRFDLDPMQVVAMGASLAAARPGVSELLNFTV